VATRFTPRPPPRSRPSYSLTGACLLLTGTCLVPEGLVMNSLTVPRSPGEAAGAICRLVKPSGEAIVINVEYNQLDALLRSTSKAADG